MKLGGLLIGGALLFVVALTVSAQDYADQQAPLSWDAQLEKNKSSAKALKAMRSFAIQKRNAATDNLTRATWSTRVAQVDYHLARIGAA